MPQTTPRLGSATITVIHEFSTPAAGQADWSSINATLDRPLTPDEKTTIEQAANSYLLFAQAEIDAPPIRLAADALKEISAASQRLTDLLSFSDPQSPMRNDALNQLNSMFLDVSWRSEGNFDAVLRQATSRLGDPHALWLRLTTFNGVCDQVRKDLARQALDGGGYPPRGAFENLIVQLMGVFESRGLTVSAAKSSVRKKTDSAFVKFAGAVYAAMPTHNTTHSPGAFAEAVAKAIGKSRAGRKAQANQPK